jgi:2-keto-4-pentenoate hydratase/2-oxohepta-3-ene-1,7-dioic acid hydratase in catechol pathway
MLMVNIEGLGATPVGTIYGIGRNYADHARELGNPEPSEEPVVFLKAASSIRGLENGVVAYADQTLHYEAELVVRIGQIVALGTEPQGWSAIDAVGLGVDLTHRDKQSELKAKGLPWSLAKSFAGASIVTPMVPAEAWNGVTDFQFKFYLENTLRQQGDTRNMIFSVPHIIRFLSRTNNLLPGDLIFTGTPAGVGPIEPGQTFRLELCNPQRAWTGRM